MKLPHLNLKGNLKYGVGAFVVGILGVYLMNMLKNKKFDNNVQSSMYANAIHFPELITRAGYNVPAFGPADPDVGWAATWEMGVDPKHDNILYNKMPYQGMQSAPVPPNFERMMPIGSHDKYTPGRTTYF